MFILCFITIFVFYNFNKNQFYMAEKKKPNVKKDSKKNKSGQKTRFKDLTEGEIEIIAITYHDKHLCHEEKIDKLKARFGIAGRTVRSWWVKLDLSIPSSKLPAQLRAARDKNIDLDTDILLVTSAQNATSINYNELEGMEEISKKFNSLGYKTQIVIIPVRYRNPTSPTEDISKKNSRERYWVDETIPYLYYNKIQFGDTLIAADLHNLPTSSEPLNGLNAIAGDNHLIVGHPRIHFNTVPRFRNDPLRTMSTTGSLTVKNYSSSRAGDKGYVHHSYGFTIIEKKKDGTCHVPRNVAVDDFGNFTDISFKWDGKKLTKTEKAEAIVLGDIHCELLKKEIFKKTAEITKVIKTKKAVLHDVLDGYRFNPHEKKDTYILRQKILQGKYMIEDEVNKAVKFPSKCKKKLGIDSIDVIESNHDIFLDRLITDGNWKTDLHNSAAYLKYALIQQTVNLREDGGCIFGHLINEKYREDDSIQYIQYGGSVRIKGIQTGLHADAGTNGSRGGVAQFKRLNVKMIGAHSHSMIIRDGYYGVGMSCEVNQDYTRRGLSTHSYGHCFIYPNGKRQLVSFGDDFEVSHFI